MESEQVVIFTNSIFFSLYDDDVQIDQTIPVNEFPMEPIEGDSDAPVSHYSLIKIRSVKRCWSLKD